MGVSWGLDRCSQMLGALPLGAPIGLSLGLFKIMMIIPFCDTSTELHAGSSGRVEVPGLAKSGLSSALLRVFHDHHRSEESPADPDQKLIPEESAPTAPAARDLGLVSLISNSISKSSEKNLESRTGG